MRFLLFIFPIQLLANIQGLISDFETGKPLIAKIYVEELKKSFSTDSNGFYSINLETGIYHIDFFKPSYELKHIEITVKDEIVQRNIALHPLSFHIENLVVTGKTNKNKTEVINNRDLLDNHRSTVAGVIKHSAGIGIRSMGTAPSRPVFRGLGGPSLEIYNDGLKTSDVSANSQDHAVALDSEFLNSVEIVRGPEVLLFNPVASSALIKVNEENIPEDEFHKLTINQKNSFESVSNRTNNFIDLGFSSFGFNTKAKVNYSQSGNTQTPIGELDNTGLNILSYSLGLSRKINDFIFGIGFNEHTNNYGIPPGGLGQHPKGVDVELFKREINFIAIHNLTNFEYFNNAELKLRRSYFDQSEFESSGLLGARFLMLNYSARYTLETKNLFGVDKGILGASYSRNDYDVGGAVETPEVLSNDFGVFVLQSKQLGEDHIDFSMRYDYLVRNAIADQSTGDRDLTDRKFNLFTTSVAYYKHINENEFGINLYRGSRAPTEEELYSFGPHLAAYSFEIGNQNLEPMTHYGGELSFNRDSEKFNIDLNLYLNYFEKYLSPQNTGEIDKIRTFLPIFQITDIEALLTGFDFSLRYYFLDDLFFDGDISYTYGEYLQTSSPIPFIQPLKSHLKITWNKSKYRIFSRLELANSQKRVDEFELPTNGYYSLDLGGFYTLIWNMTAINLGLNIENITNNVYRNHLSRIKDIMPEPGINVKLFINIHY